MKTDNTTDAPSGLRDAACSPSFSDTPETDSALCVSRHPNDLLGWPEGRKATFGTDYIVPASFARKLERERNDAWQILTDAMQYVYSAAALADPHARIVVERFEALELTPGQMP